MGKRETYYKYLSPQKSQKDFFLKNWKASEAEKNTFP